MLVVGHGHRISSLGSSWYPQPEQSAAPKLWVLFSSTVQSWYTAYQKLDYFTQLEDALQLDISDARDVYAYSRCSELIRGQSQKAAIVGTIVEHLRRLPWDGDYSIASEAILMAELELRSFDHVFSANYERVVRHFEGALLEVPPVRETLFRIRRDQHMRGRMQRFVFLRLTRDIRKIYRTIVRSLFKQMDDQSGDDEFFVQSTPCYRQFFSSKTRFFHGFSRSISPN